MTSGSKRRRIKAFFTGPFSKEKGIDAQRGKPTVSLTAGSSNVTVNEPAAGSSKIVLQESSPQGPRIHSSSSGDILDNDRDVSKESAIPMANQVSIHKASDRTKVMELLFEHIIRGADHDSSARGHPPWCHPGTRLEISKRIITWFYDEEKKELLIWLYDPAGVGKSDIMQILVEKLAASKHLGASVFISQSKAKERNSSRQLFMTIGYQLALHIDGYCSFIANKLSRNPFLVNEGMEEQFKVFIVEPFVEEKIGAGGARWGILLDGLDELDERHSQQEIIRLISNLVLQHPDIPLYWVIASRPEPHICDIFNDEKVVPAYWKECVPADSTEACHDVERFLYHSLENIREDFPRTVPDQWPSKEQFLSLAATSSGLFILANTAIRFIKDRGYANPPMRLRQLLSALDSTTATFDDSPFVYLDALYTDILGSIPSDVWLTTKRVLGTLLYARRGGVLSVLGILSVVLRLDLDAIYTALIDCYSILDIPLPKNTYSEPATFHHASFSDYLWDPNRSKKFYISREEVQEHLLQSSLILWRNFEAHCPPTPGLRHVDRWTKYWSESLSCDVTTYGPEFCRCIHELLFTSLTRKHELEHADSHQKEI